MNCGLLDPLLACRRAEAAWRAGDVPINNAEGFIRQIIGWREYMRGMYWLDMPGLDTANHLAATRPLPEFYWTGETAMHCLAEAVRNTRDNAYAHHIQRLMVLGNFAMLAGVDRSTLAGKRNAALVLLGFATAARVSAESFGPGARRASQAMMPRRRSTYFRTAKPRPGWGAVRSTRCSLSGS